MAKERAPRKEKEPVKGFVETLVDRMVDDLEEIGYLKGGLTMENRPRSGDVFYSRWLLADEKTRVSVYFIEDYSDKTLIEADQILKGKDKYKSYKAVQLLDLNPQDIPIPSPTMKINTDLSQMIGKVFIKQTESGSVLEDIFFNSARHASKLRNEVWGIFKVVESGQIKCKIITDSTALGPRYLNEPGSWSVPDQKINNLNREIPRAELLEARFMPRNSQEEDTLTLWNSLIRVSSR